MRVAVVETYGKTLTAEVGQHRFDPCGNRPQLLFVSENRHDDHMDRRQFRRKNETVVIGVRQDQRADEAGADTPRSTPDVIQLSVFARKLNIEGLCKILTEKMRRAGLQCPTILHDRLDAVRSDSAGEFLPFAFPTLVHGHSHKLFGKGGVYVEHLKRFPNSLFCGGVRRMTLLPQKFRGTQEQARTHFPAYNVS